VLLLLFYSLWLSVCLCHHRVCAIAEGEDVTDDSMTLHYIRTPEYISGATWPQLTLVCALELVLQIFVCVVMKVCCNVVLISGNYL